MQPDVEMVKSMNQYDSGKNNDGNNMICDCDIVKMKKVNKYIRKHNYAREICETLGVSRRALQGYEKAGLVTASGRNKYGHLLYDKDAEMRIAQIK